MTMGVTAKPVKYCEMLIEADPPKPRRDTGKACMRIGMSTGMRMRGKSGFANESRGVKASLTAVQRKRDSGSGTAGRWLLVCDASMRSALVRWFNGAEMKL